MTKNDVEYPWVTFQIRGENYCISSEYVLQMIISSDDLTGVPNSPDYLSGLLNLRGEVFPIIDLRLLLGMETLKSELSGFSIMKEKHLEWIIALERSIKEDIAFTLARDPHQCAFGMWYDSFHTENNSINHILDKINLPHQEMHKQAQLIDQYRSKGDNDGVKKSFDQAVHLCHDIIAPLLDELIIAYVNSNKGMVILMKKDSATVGISVDVVHSIQNFQVNEEYNEALRLANKKYIKNIIVAETGTLYLELDLDVVTSLGQEYL